MKILLFQTGCSPNFGLQAPLSNPARLKIHTYEIYSFNRKEHPALFGTFGNWLLHGDVLPCTDD